MGDRHITLPLPLFSIYKIKQWNYTKRHDPFFWVSELKWISFPSRSSPPFLFSPSLLSPSLLSLSFLSPPLLSPSFLLPPSSPPLLLERGRLSTTSSETSILSLQQVRRRLLWRQNQHPEWLPTMDQSTTEKEKCSCQVCTRERERGDTDSWY